MIFLLFLDYLIIVLGSNSDSNQGELFISEVMAANNGFIGDQYGDDDDWIEIGNSSDTTMFLSGYFLSDDPKELRKFQFQNDSLLTKIEPNTYKLIWADNDTSQGALHLNFKLKGSGEQLFLVKPDGVTIVDRIKWTELEENISFGRVAAGKHERFMAPTPMQPNLPRSQKSISFSLTGGFYSVGEELELSCPEPCDIRYTMDGSLPTEQSQLYESDILIDETTVIRASVFETGFNPSKPVTHTYIIKSQHQLPIVSITTDPTNLWSDEYGIYAKGSRGKAGNCVDQPVNWNMDWEVPAHIEYYPNSGESGFVSDIGIEIAGRCSRRFRQKSLKLKWRKRFGESTLKYHVFKAKSIVTFKDLVLRNAGNEFGRSFITDPLVYELIRGKLDVDGQAYLPVVVYINGEYWGIQNLRERINTNYVETNYPESRNGKINILENHVNLVEGDPSDFMGLKNEIASANKKEIELLLSKNFDLDSFIDYYIAQIYLGNSDWPQNNVRYWNEKISSTKWRYLFYDADLTMKLDGFEKFNYLGRILGEEYEFVTDDRPKQLDSNIRLFFNAFWSIPSYRESFIARYQVHINSTFKPDSVVTMINKIADQVKPEIYDHRERWKLDPIEWDKHIADLKEFSRVRPNYALQNLLKVLGGGQIAKVQFINNNPESGKVFINRIQILDQNNAEFAGDFITSSPLELIAHANPGYQFSHWSLDIGKEEISRNVLSWYPEDGFSLTAHFKPDSGYPEHGSYKVYPNPCSDVLKIDGDHINKNLGIEVGIFRLSGALVDVVRYMTPHQFNYDVNKLSSGLYILQIKQLNENLISTHKVLIK